MGPRGPTGPAGLTGATGPTGPAGINATVTPSSDFNYTYGGAGGLSVVFQAGATGGVPPYTYSWGNLQLPLDDLTVYAYFYNPTNSSSQRISIEGMSYSPATVTADVTVTDSVGNSSSESVSFTMVDYNLPSIP